MRTLTLALLLGALAAPLPAAAQATPEQEVAATVVRLFDGMRAGDSTVVRSVFHPSATLRSVEVRDGSPVLTPPVGADRFVQAVGTPHDQVWDERIGKQTIHVDGNLATSWMEYAFYLGDKLSHCGVNAFHLARGADGWKVFHIADTRRREGCTDPAAPAR